MIITENQSQMLRYLDGVVDPTDYQVILEETEHYKIYIERSTLDELLIQESKINVEQLIYDGDAILEIAPAIIAGARVVGAILTADSVRDAVNNAKKGDYFKALLAILPAIIPGAGKLLGKGGKAMLKTGKMAKAGGAVAKTGSAIEKFGKWALANEDKIRLKFDELKKIKVLDEYINKIESKFNEFVKKNSKD